MIITGEQNELLRGMIPFLKEYETDNNLHCIHSDGTTTVFMDGATAAWTTRLDLPAGLWRVVKSLVKRTELEQVDGKYPCWRHNVPPTDATTPLLIAPICPPMGWQDTDASLYLCTHGLYKDKQGQSAIAHHYVDKVLAVAGIIGCKTITVYQNDYMSARLFDMGDTKAIVMPLWMGRE